MRKQVVLHLASPAVCLSGVDGAEQEEGVRKASWCWLLVRGW